MSWFTRSIANTLNFDDDQDAPNPQPNSNNPPEPSDSQPLSPGRGVKEDLSELTKTLTRQFWGVASFLAPLPSADPGLSSGPSDPDQPDLTGIPGIRSDFAEIGGRFRSGISKLSNNMAAVSEITSKMASNFLQLGDDDDHEGRDYSDSSTRGDGGGGIVGVNEEVVAFVNDIAMHPETWLDFPLPNDDDEQEDFDISDVQQEHALAVERLVPRLAALRMELCPGYMSDAFFWKIYFVLLHPRLDRHDAELLSTPEIVEARTLLKHSIKNRTKENTEQESSADTPYSKDVGNLPDEERLSVPSALHSNSVLIETSAIESFTSPPAADFETEKYPVASSEGQIIDKSVIKEGNVDKNNDQNLHYGATLHVVEKSDEDDADDWLKEETSENVGSSRTTIPIDNDEDVSFSDLEEDEGDVPTRDKKVTYYSFSSTKDSRDWVQLSSRSSAVSTKDINSVGIDERAGSEQVRTNDSDTKESNDWLDLDDIDVA